MDVITTILIVFITSGVVTALFNWFVASRERADQRRWGIKREACLEALEIIDARFADYDWRANGKAQRVDHQDFVPITKIRSCFNRLALACNDSEVPRLFEKCLHLNVEGSEPEPMSMSTVVGLRNAIRKELGFSNELRTNISWITYITWHHANKKKQ
jgi:hypothetical protein